MAIPAFDQSESRARPRRSLSVTVKRRLRKAGLLASAGVLFALLALEESLLPLIWRQALSGYMFDHGPWALCLSLAAGALAVGGLGFMRREAFAAPTQADIERALHIVARHPNAAAGLVRLGDKSLLFSECGEGFIMYGRQNRAMIALFDPVGPQALWAPLAQRFMEAARAQGCRPVFYQASPAFLPIAVETKCKVLKLGEQAIIDLAHFSLAGGRWLNLRRAINRAERDGLTFEIVDREGVSAILPDLKQVSDAWLATQSAGEKGFSLGVFRPDYVTASPVAVIRLEGKIVAFANILMSEGDAFIDLMRHTPGVHRGVMDLLFVRIMENLRDQGLRRLNLGMAPLAGLTPQGNAPLWNRIGAQIFQKGERFYNFRGVREFKSKFNPHWEPRYLVAPGIGFPAGALFDVTLLIGGGLKSVLRK
jgi:phosphatidylglycerol lysyltransferase